MRILVMVAATFAVVGGVDANGWRSFPHVCAGVAIWFGVLAATYVVEFLFEEDE